MGMTVKRGFPLPKNKMWFLLFLGMTVFGKKRTTVFVFGKKGLTFLGKTFKTLVFGEKGKVA